MTWTLRERASRFKGLEPVQYATNEDGVEIEPLGYDVESKSVEFNYSDGASTISFYAWRPRQGWIDYDPTKMTFKNFTLGPIAEVLVEIRDALSSDRIEKIERDIADFLLGDFQRFRLAIAPYPERVVFVR